MEDLIEALTIFLKYNNFEYPTCCRHDTLYIPDVAPEDVSNKDKIRLKQLGFDGHEDGWFFSIKFGSN